MYFKHTASSRKFRRKTALFPAAALNIKVLYGKSNRTLPMVRRNVSYRELSKILCFNCNIRTMRRRWDVLVLVKVKSLSTLFRLIRGADVKLHTFSALTLDGGERSTSRSCRFVTGRGARYSPYKRQGGSLSPFGRFGEGGNLLALPRFQPWTAQPSLATLLWLAVELDYMYAIVIFGFC